jgi:hypothetical protein
VGLAWAIHNRLELDGVVIVGDGGENQPPFFVQQWHEYKKRFDKELPTYLYQTYCDSRYSTTVGGDPKNFEISMNGGTLTWAAFPYPPVPFTKFDLTHGQVDYASLPNLCQTMSANRFGVIERIMACPLVRLEQVIDKNILVDWQCLRTPDSNRVSAESK